MQEVQVVHEVAVEVQPRLNHYLKELLLEEVKAVMRRLGVCSFRFFCLYCFSLSSLFSATS